MTVRSEYPDADELSGLSTTELVQRVGDLVSRLVRDELALAKAELTEKARRAGIGIGLFSGAGLLVAYAVGVFVAAMVLGLAVWLPAWAAAVVTGLILLLVAAILGWQGRRQLDHVNPPVPEQAVASVRADLDELKRSVRR
jgi:uncharacterized membrane protein YqjE